MNIFYKTSQFGVFMFSNLKKYIILSITIISVIISDVKIYAEELTLNAISAVLYDGDAGRVLYGKNENQIMNDFLRSGFGRQK